MTTPSIWDIGEGKKFGERIPVQRFRGKLLSHVPGTRPPFQGGSGKETNFMGFNFGELTIIETTEPWTLPTLEIQINYSEWEGSPWKLFAKSMRDLVPLEAYAASQDPLSILDGKIQEWYKMPYQGRVQDPETKAWVTGTQLAWVIAGIEGFGGASGPGLMDLIVDYADGKTAQQVKDAIYNTSEWRGMQQYSAAVEAAASNSLLVTLCNQGKLSQDVTGVYHKVG